MNSKNLGQRLANLGYTLTRKSFGWVVISVHTNYQWTYPTLVGVKRFVVDEEGLATR